MRFKEFSELPVLDSVIVPLDDNAFELYEGRKWVSGRFDKNIGIDQPTYGAGQQHAHVYGRKNNQLVVVNFDGSGSHGTKGRLHKDDADALRAKGYTIRSNNIVEWQIVENPPTLLFG